MGHPIKTGTCTHFLKYFEIPGTLVNGSFALQPLALDLRQPLQCPVCSIQHAPGPDPQPGGFVGTS